MWDRIKLLPEKVANQIAAGEVVIHPSSVVKEMMENTIDAGATEVVVNFKDGGFDLIQIVDNGCGMSPNDARMAFDRHATSKISSAQDIYALRTFGFRGEALASIGAVAQVELTTKQEGDEMGTLTEVHGGDFINQSVVICPTGSQFRVRNLFYNIPVRRRFAGKSNTSTNQIKEEFKRVALCYPRIHFELYNNDAPIYSLPPATLASRIVDIVGRSMKQSLLECSAETSIVKIKGFVGHPNSAKKRGYDQYLFVNGRYFRSTSFSKAVLRGYDKLITEGSFPSFFLFLEVEPEQVDVNIHPQKTEVKFAEEESIWQIINAATREALAKSGAISLMEFDNASSIEIPVAQKGMSYAVPRSNSQDDYNPFREDYIDTRGSVITEEFTGFDAPFNEEVITKSTPKTRSSGRLMDSGYEVVEAFEQESYKSGSGSFAESAFEFIESAPTPPSQGLFEDIASTQEVVNFREATPLGGGYISAIMGAELVVVDGRRAKERILFDHYLQLLNCGNGVSQQLLFPVRLMISEEEYDVMEQNATEFAILGFDIDYCGAGVIEVKGIPADSSQESIDTLIYELIQLVSTPLDVEEQRREKLATTMARSGATSIKGLLSKGEANELLTQLGTSSNFTFSPSGKEIFWRVTLEEIKRRLA